MWWGLVIWCTPGTQRSAWCLKGKDNKCFPLYPSQAAPRLSVLGWSPYIFAALPRFLQRTLLILHPASSSLWEASSGSSDVICYRNSFVNVGCLPYGSGLEMFSCCVPKVDMFVCEHQGGWGLPSTFSNPGFLQHQKLSLLAGSFLIMITWENGRPEPLPRIDCVEALTLDVSPTQHCMSCPTPLIVLLR